MTVISLNYRIKKLREFITLKIIDLITMKIKWESNMMD
jgi:hypothetical protein